MERITLNTQHRYGKKLRKIYHPGVYRVGPDITPELAAELIRKGAATKVDKPQRFLQRGKSRGAAPENKALDTRNLTTKME